MDCPLLTRKLTYQKKALPANSKISEFFETPEYSAHVLFKTKQPHLGSREPKLRNKYGMWGNCSVENSSYGLFSPKKRVKDWHFLSKKAGEKG